MMFIIAAPTGPPRNIEVETTPTSLSLSWNSPIPNLQNGIIRHYLIRVIEHETSVTSQLQSSGMDIMISTLHPFYTYKYSISAVTIDAGPYSEPTSVKLPQAGTIFLTMNTLSQ